jgi:glutaredoxin
MWPASHLYLVSRLACKNFYRRPYKQPLTHISNWRKSLSPKVHVIVYSKPGCHLCEEAKEAIRRADCDDHFILEEVNIETDPLLVNSYQYDIPVITIDGVKAFKHRLTPDQFRERILRYRSRTDGRL